MNIEELCNAMKREYPTCPIVHLAICQLKASADSDAKIRDLHPAKFTRHDVMKIIGEV